MTEAEISQILEYTTIDARALDQAIAIRGPHWSVSGIVQPGQRCELEIGRAVELVCRVQVTRTWELLRKPPWSSAWLNGARLGADVPGVYIVRCVLARSWVRDIELVAAPTALLDKIGARDALNDRRLTFRCRINEPSVTTEALIEALESNPPTWGALAAPAYI